MNITKKKKKKKKLQIAHDSMFHVEKIYTYYVIDKYMYTCFCEER